MCVCVCVCIYTYVYIYSICAVFSLLARLLYAPWAALVEDALQVHGTLTRYRIAMGLCILPCVVGVWWLASRHKF